ncbi:hypothetical protein [Thermosphaera sp.]
MLFGRIGPIKSSSSGEPVVYSASLFNIQNLLTLEIFFEFRLKTNTNVSMNAKVFDEGLVYGTYCTLVGSRSGIAV